MVICAAFGCKSRSGKVNVIIFFQFPNDKKLKKIWCTKIGRASHANIYTYLLYTIANAE